MNAMLEALTRWMFINFSGPAPCRISGVLLLKGGIVQHVQFWSIQLSSNQEYSWFLVLAGSLVVVEVVDLPCDPHELLHVPLQRHIVKEDHLRRKRRLLVRLTV